MNNIHWALSISMKLFHFTKTKNNCKQWNPNISNLKIEKCWRCLGIIASEIGESTFRILQCDMLKIDIVELCIGALKDDWHLLEWHITHSSILIITSQWWSTGILSGSVDFLFFTFLPHSLLIRVWQWSFLHLSIHLFSIRVFALQIIDISCAHCIQMFNNMVLA